MQPLKEEEDEAPAQEESGQSSAPAASSSAASTKVLDGEDSILRAMESPLALSVVSTDGRMVFVMRAVPDEEGQQNGAGPSSAASKRSFVLNTYDPLRDFALLDSVPLIRKSASSSFARSLRSFLFLFVFVVSCLVCFCSFVPTHHGCLFPFPLPA